ncbi:hypothetical protein [Armatimonas sp.]|uniref:hypothetical protein n=1 Tax=Armatimonas sp. TaxID=1872638 RepID=UPI00286BCC3A|nr:hypothetical protein [Armatimonas sp.]
MQKQKQRSQTKQPELAAGVRAIATLDLLLGVPLALWIMWAFLKEPIPRDSAGVVFGVAFFTFVLALNGAGACLLLRHRALARVFQWLLAIFALFYTTLMVLMNLKNHFVDVPLPLVIGIGLVTLTLITLALVLQKFGED